MTYDLIIIVKSGLDRIHQITQHCINTCRADADVNVILVETSGLQRSYEGVNRTIMYQGAFNYNRALNLGLEYAEGDVHILANNDLVFHKGWSQIGELMWANNLESASALSQSPQQKAFERGDYIYVGYDVGLHISGWCLFLSKEGHQKIGKLDETYDFWYSDNAYADQLREHGIRHGIFCNIFIDHITSVTLKTIPWRDRHRYSIGQRNKIRYAI